MAREVRQDGGGKTGKVRQDGDLRRHFIVDKMAVRLDKIRYAKMEKWREGTAERTCLDETVGRDRIQGCNKGIAFLQIPLLQLDTSCTPIVSNSWQCN